MLYAVFWVPYSAFSPFSTAVSASVVLVLFVCIWPWHEGAGRTGQGGTADVGWPVGTRFSRFTLPSADRFGPILTHTLVQSLACLPSPSFPQKCPSLSPSPSGDMCVCVAVILFLF